MKHAYPTNAAILSTSYPLQDIYKISPHSREDMWEAFWSQNYAVPAKQGRTHVPE